MCWVRSLFFGYLFSLLNKYLNLSSENYFEMSHVDAKEALNIYRQFCQQTDLVVEYLGVAKKLQNLLNVPVPSLKHVGALPLFFYDLC
jgi:phosphatidylinositol-binding clathrin assembly protein